MSALDIIEGVIEDHLPPDGLDWRCSCGDEWTPTHIATELEKVFTPAGHLPDDPAQVIAYGKGVGRAIPAHCFVCERDLTDDEHADRAATGCGKKCQP